ncbi:MAG: DUF4097 family beta strand repeat-containing protein [Acidobacteriota bacterium]
MEASIVDFAPRATETEVFEFSADATPRLEVRLDQGVVRVERGETGRVVVRANAPLGETVLGSTVKIERHGDTLMILPRKRAVGGESGSQAEIDLEVEFPARGELDLRSHLGDFEVYDIDGEIDMRSDRGSLVLEGSSGTLLLQTGSGSIDLIDLGQSVVRATTDSGAVRYRGGSLTDGRYSFTTASGPIEIEHHREAHYTIVGRTLSGDVSNQVDGVISDDSRWGPVKHLHGEYGLDHQAASTVQVISASGDISLALSPQPGDFAVAASDQPSEPE